MRHFRHLTRSEISEIVVAHQEGQTRAAIAQRYDVDPSTVSYHIQKFERAYLEEGTVYSLVKVDIRKTCVHPSSRCTFCGIMRDELARTERETIRTLTARLHNANSKLRMAGLPVD